MIYRNTPVFRRHAGIFCTTVLLLFAAGAPAGTWYMKPWKDMYGALHAGSVPEWKTIDDARSWARLERAQVEPIVIAVLRGERADIPWTHALPVARELGSPAICDELLAHLQVIVAEKPNPCYVVGEENAGSIAQIMDTLGKARDQRIASFAVALAAKDCQSSFVVEHCVDALRNVGNLSALNSISGIPLRSRSRHIDRLCRMAEKSIRARAENRSLSPNAQQELRDVATRFVRSALAEDLAGYVACFPYGAAQVIDRGDLKEFLNHVDGRPGLAAVDKALAAGKPFTVDLDKLRATLLCGVSFELDCVLEVDGWKIANLKRIPAP